MILNGALHNCLVYNAQIHHYDGGYKRRLESSLINLTDEMKSWNLFCSTWNALISIFLLWDYCPWISTFTEEDYWNPKQTTLMPPYFKIFIFISAAMYLRFLNFHSYSMYRQKHDERFSLAFFQKYSLTLPSAALSPPTNFIPLLTCIKREKWSVFSNFLS